MRGAGKRRYRENMRPGGCVGLELYLLGGPERHFRNSFHCPKIPEGRPQDDTDLFLPEHLGLFIFKLLILIIKYSHITLIIL